MEKRRKRMGEVKELGKTLTAEQAQAMVEKATAQTMAQMNAGQPDRLTFVFMQIGRWIWRRTAPSGEVVACSAFTYESFNLALANFNRTCIQKIDLNVEIEQPKEQMAEGSGATLMEELAQVGGEAMEEEAEEETLPNGEDPAPPAAA